MAYSTTLVEEIRIRAKARSMMGTARDFGVPRERLYQIQDGGSVGSKSASRILAKIREDDLALADKIEDELLASWRDELRRRDQ